MLTAYNFIQKDRDSARRKIQEYLKNPPAVKPGETAKTFEFCQLLIEE